MAELERFRSLVDISSDLLFVVEHPSGRILDVSAACCERLGMDRNSLLSLSFCDLVPPAACEAILALAEKSRLGFGPHGLVTTEITNSESQRKLPVEIAVEYLQLGDSKVAIFAARDITERKRAEDALRASEAYLAEAQRLSHTGSWAWETASDKYVYVSEECLRIFGFDPQEGVPTGEAVLRQIHPEDRNRWKENLEKSLREKADTSDEYRIVLPDGTIKHIHTIRHPVLNDAGDVVQLVGTSIDITERRRAEEALRRSEAYLAEGQRLSHTGSWAWSPITRQSLYWSEEMFRIFALDPQQGVPTSEVFWERVHPEDRGRTYEILEDAALRASEYAHDHRIMLPNGSVKRIHAIGHPVLNEAGKLVEYLGTAMDVTEQEHLTQELQRREAYLAEAQRLSHTGSFGWHVQSGEHTWSEETYKIFEYDRAAKPTLELVLQRTHPDDRVLVQQTVARASNDSTGFDYEHRLLMPDGRVKHLHVVADALQDSSGAIEFVGAVMDITAAKLAEEKIRLIIDTVPAMLWTAQPDGNIDFINQSWLNFTGLTLEQGLGWGWEPAFHPDDLGALLSEWRAALASGKPLDTETRLRRFDGEYRWMLSRASPLCDRSGHILGWYGINTDIHDRKLAEDRPRLVLDSTPALLHTARPDGYLDFFNQTWLRYVGLPLEDLQGWKWTAAIHPEDVEGFVNKWRASLACGEPSLYEARVRRADGEYRWLLHHTIPERDEHGKIVKWFGSSIDIEDRKRAEELLRQEEAELRQVLDLTPQHITVRGPDMSRLYANHAALDYYGLTLEEWQSRDTRSLVHPDDSERLMGGLRGELTSGHQTEGRLLRKDGKYRWFLFRMNSLQDEEGRVMRWYLTGTDIDDRKQAEERLQHENVALREEIDKTSMFEEIVGASPALQSVLSRVSKVAPTDSTVLLTGETGTGKELIARAIHRRSHRSSRAFVSVNCAAIPRDLIASELFGHEKGAFTGATQQRLGRFELAGGGTIFLDEVGELPAETQIALLRVLQEHEFERVGGTRSIHADVRVIAATNRDLQAAIAAGAFRDDLFYRLNVFPIEIPPLRERKEDIPLLVEYFIDRFARKAGKSIRGINKKSLDLLQSYPWPGNIRELQNVIERSVIVCETEVFSVDESWLSRQPLEVETKSPLDLNEKLAAQEKEIIEAALRECGGRVFGPSGAAARLGMPRSTLESKIRSLKINKNRFKTAASGKDN
jgi:formate hydrogenlyase transcriptional activator